MHSKFKSIYLSSKANSVSHFILEIIKNHPSFFQSWWNSVVPICDQLIGPDGCCWTRAGKVLILNLSTSALSIPISLACDFARSTNFRRVIMSCIRFDAPASVRLSAGMEGWCVQIFKVLSWIDFRIKLILYDYRLWIYKYACQLLPTVPVLYIAWVRKRHLLLAVRGVGKVDWGASDPCTSPDSPSDMT